MGGNSILAMWSEKNLAQIKSSEEIFLTDVPPLALVR